MCITVICAHVQLYSTCESIHFSLVYMQGEYVLKVDPPDGWTFSKYMGTVRTKSKQGNTTNLNISFSMENEKRAAQVGFEPTAYCLRGRCSTN